MSNILKNTLDKWAYSRIRNQAIRTSNYANPLANFVWGNNEPAWVSLKTPEHLEAAARNNPIVKANINLLATSASNGRKYLIDAKSKERIDWDDNNEVVKKMKQLLTRPNPLQSGSQFEEQGVFYKKVFGNRYVNPVMPSGFDQRNRHYEY